MKACDAFMPLFIGDYAGDTMHLTLPQHGAYLLLLMHAWRVGPLPADDESLAAIVKVTPRFWRAKLASKMLPFFTLRDGCLYQKRLDFERARAMHITDIKRNAANERWDREKRRKSANVDPSTGSQSDACAYAHDHADDMQTPMQTALPSPVPSSLRSEEDSDAPRLAHASRSHGRRHDPRSLLWREGIPIVRSLTGRGDRAARTTLGRWLADLRDDCPTMLTILQHAASARPADPVAWVTRAVATRPNGSGGVRASNLDWMADKLGIKPQETPH